MELVVRLTPVHLPRAASRGIADRTIKCLRSKAVSVVHATSRRKRSGSETCSRVVQADFLQCEAGYGTPRMTRRSHITSLLSNRGQKETLEGYFLKFDSLQIVDLTFSYDAERAERPNWSSGCIPAVPKASMDKLVTLLRMQHEEHALAPPYPVLPWEQLSSSASEKRSSYYGDGEMIKYDRVVCARKWQFVEEPE